MKCKYCEGGHFLKTFKLISFQFLNKAGNIRQIPLKEALIINMENDQNTWVIELFIDQMYLKGLEVYSSDEEFPVSVVITKPENDPANFFVKIVKKKIIGEFASVLLEGKLIRSTGYAEKLLESLMEKGLAGEELLQTFREEIKDKKRLLGKEDSLEMP